MIKEVKTYICDWPTDDAVNEALEIVKGQPFAIRLEWIHKWSGKYNVLIEDGDTFDDVKNRLPKIYGL